MFAICFCVLCFYLDTIPLPSRPTAILFFLACQSHTSVPQIERPIETPFGPAPSDVTTKSQEATAIGTEQRFPSELKDVPVQLQEKPSSGWLGWIFRGRRPSQEHVMVDTHEQERWDHWSTGNPAPMSGRENEDAVVGAYEHVPIANDRMAPFDPHNRERGIYDSPLATPAVSSAASPSAPGWSFFRRRPSEPQVKVPTEELSERIVLHPKGDNGMLARMQREEPVPDDPSSMTTDSPVIGAGRSIRRRASSDNATHIAEDLQRRMQRDEPVPEDPSTMTTDSPVGSSIRRLSTENVKETAEQVQRRMSDAVREVTSATARPAQSTWLWQRPSKARIEKSSFRHVMPEDLSLQNENLSELIDEANLGSV